MCMKIVSCASYTITDTVSAGHLLAENEIKVPKPCRMTNSHPAQTDDHVVISCHVDSRWNEIC